MRRGFRAWAAAALALFASCGGTGASSDEAAGAERPERVVVASLDGLGQRIWDGDPAARQLPSLERVVEGGVEADGLVQAYPPGTPGGHAALWTGAFGNVSGIVGGNPVTPRAEHTAFERTSGFDARLLEAEPLWVTAARQGVRVVANQATQNHPFVPFVTASSSAEAPVLVSGYGPPMLEDHRVLRPEDTEAADPAAWGTLADRSSRPVRAFRFELAGASIHGALVAEEATDDGYTAMYLADDPGGDAVRAGAAPLEDSPPRDRPLARHFSEGLPLRAGPDSVPTLAFFRLFELDPSGEDFVLYHPAAHEIALHDGSGAEEGAVADALEAGAAFVGNGPSYLMRDGDLGTQLHAGGDGTAERRYLEGLELVMRQYDRLTSWLVERYDPGLLIDYAPYPDEADHWWYGLAHPDVEGVDPKVRATYQELRERAYATLDRRVGLLDSIAGPDGALVVVSDHGMTPVWKRVRVNRVLEEAGFLEQDAEGEIDPSRTRAVHVKHYLLLNTEDWREGIVPLEERDAVVEALEAALREVRDPWTGEPVFRDFFRPETDGDELGIGGPAGGDLYFDLAPGYLVDDGLEGDAIEELPVPRGWHGYLPTREDMLAVLLARGPGLPEDDAWPRLRAVDVAPLIAELLGIDPPADAVGSSPLGDRSGDAR